MYGFVEDTWLFKFNSLSLQEIVRLDILMLRLALAILEIAAALQIDPFLIHYQSICLPLQ